MTYELILVTYMAIITWLLLFVAAIIRTRAWTVEGVKRGFGNRENLPEKTKLSGRADRAAQNTLENFIIFFALVSIAHLGKIASPEVVKGAEIFFWARVVYIPVYLIGIPYLRTILWVIGVVGLVIIAKKIITSYS